MQKINISEDAAHTEFILVFHIAAVTPFQHQYCQTVFAVLQNVCQVKFAGGTGNLTVADIFAVDPNIEAGINAFKDKICIGCIIFSFVVEIPHICTAGIILWYIWRIEREGITNISILMRVVPEILPYPGNRDGIKLTHIKIVHVKFFFQIINAGKIFESPVAVQQLESIGFFSIFYQIVHHFGCRNVVTSVRHRVFMQHMGIFIIFFNNHYCTPPCCLYYKFSFQR